MNRTDLAIEAPVKGLQQKERGRHFSITEIIIDSDELGKTIGKSKGRYVTLETDVLNRFAEDYSDFEQELSEEIADFLPKDGLIFVIGLGNNDITPDSLGPKTVSKILATRHLNEKSLRSVSILSTGVLAQTGIETAEIAEAICKKINPAAVLVIDALACLDIARLGKTIQISDTGISPGSGVKNSRKTLNSQTLGVPVIAIGVPTVVDIYTIVKTITGIEKVESSLENMLVTPRDIDLLIDNTADLIAAAINSALNPTVF
jgi:spore protease